MQLQKPSSRIYNLLSSNIFPGILLIISTIISIVIANTSFGEAWHAFWNSSLKIGIDNWSFEKTLEHWINDGLMVIFFFFIGLEIKHELMHGQLSSVRRAALPIFAAIGGMIAPAILYLYLTAGRQDQELVAGWGIPMATDIAFALGILTLLGTRVPAALKVFLASLAIVDDLGAIMVIAIFYTEQIAWGYLGAAIILLAVSYLTNRLGVNRLSPYILYGFIIWVLFLKSGIHATIAGVALAFTVPDRTPAVRSGTRTDLGTFSTLKRFENCISPLVSYLIIPLFALANAGVGIVGELSNAVTHPAAQGVFMGLVIGKPLGIMFLSWVAVRVFSCALPDGSTWKHIHGVSWLAGIGFTMSLFINALAFGSHPQAYEAAKIGILAASVVAGSIGYIILARIANRSKEN